MLVITMFFYIFFKVKSYMKINGYKKTYFLDKESKQKIYKKRRNNSND